MMIRLLCIIASAMFSAILVPGVKSRWCQQILNPSSSRYSIISVSTKGSSAWLTNKQKGTKITVDIQMCCKVLQCSI